LDVFKDLLGRLNGKSSETIQKEQAIRSELKTSLYVERKYGPMRFVKGGLLVGDQIMEQLKKEEEEVKATDVIKADMAIQAANDDEPTNSKKEKKSKKRRAEETDSLDDAGIDQERKKKKKRSYDDSPSDSTKSDPTTESGKRKKKDKKGKKSKSTKVEDEDETSGDKLKTKKSKKSKKSKGDSKGDADQSDGGDNLKSPTPEDTERSKKKKKRRKHLDVVETPAEASNEALIKSAGESGVSTPVETGTSTPQSMSSRHMVRSRNIASKRLAMADMAALNQVCLPIPGQRQCFANNM
jgi:Pin2-interacting protein X1